MKNRNFAFSLALAVLSLSTVGAFAQFSGVFSGYYAPSDWTIAVSGNPTYDNFAGVITTGAPDNVTIYGAFGFGTVPSTPSIIDYSIVLSGSGPVEVSFSYTFFNPGFVQDKAEVLDNGVVVANLTAVNSQYYSNPGTFMGGQTLDFRVFSANVNQFDFLEIAPIPEPSTLTLAGLGGAALLFKLRRKTARR